MQKSLGRAVVLPCLLVMILGTAACNKNKNDEQVNEGQGNVGGPGGPRGPIGEIMSKLAKGPQSLTKQIGNELKTDPTPWDTIQPQAKEYAELASKMSKYDPPKGDKESWLKLTGTFSKTATDLDRSAEAKDKPTALAAHQALENSCKACHDAHRAGRGGPGGMGMPPGGFRGPGGPPRPPQ